MSHVDLRIEMDRDDLTYRFGEEIRGVIHVTVHETVHCRALEVDMEWWIHGRGMGDNGGREEEDLFRGTWEAGETHEVPFVFNAPARPMTYRGELFDVDWIVTARARISGADARDSLVIKVRPDEGGIVEAFGMLGPEDVTITRSGVLDSWWRFVAILLGLVLIAAGIGAGYWVSGVHWGPVSRQDLILALVFGVPLVIAGIVLLLIVIQARLTRILFGDVHWTVQPEELRPGEAIEVEVSFDASFTRRIGRVQATLRATESVTEGWRKHTWQVRHVLIEKRGDLAQPGEVIPGRPRRWRGRFRIPPGCPPSFQSWLNRVRWTVGVRIPMRWWPDWHREREIVVHPGGRSV